MKRKIFTGLCLCALSATLAACGSAAYTDGVYRAETGGFEDGWKETVEVTIMDGRIDRVDWDAISDDPNIPVKKKQYSKSGLYGMLQGGASNEWCDQAKSAEDYILQNDGTAGITYDADGYTDVISGCTIEVKNLVELTDACLTQARK